MSDQSENVLIELKIRFNLQNGKKRIKKFNFFKMKTFVLFTDG